MKPGSLIQPVGLHQFGMLIITRIDQVLLEQHQQMMFVW